MKKVNPTHIYQFLKNLFLKQKDNELKLKLAELIGNVAANNYVEVFRDIEIEQFLHEYGTQFSSDVVCKKPKNNIVHIFSTVYRVGGHTRLAEQIIQCDKKHTHHILILNQEKNELRDELIQAAEVSGGKIFILPKANLSTKANLLTEFISQYAEKVFLHIHPEDYLPSLVLNGFSKQIDFFFVNHADHRFSYGVDLATTTINIREEAAKISYHLRSSKANFILPLPINKEVFNEGDIITIKAEYNLPQDAVVALSIGSPYKFQDHGGYHFFKTIYQALEENQNLYVFIVGINEEQLKNLSILSYCSHNRLFLLGRIDNPSKLQAIADIALDPMPYGSYTALLETCFYGAYPLVCYNTQPLFNLYLDLSFQGKIELDKTEEEYLHHFSELCRHKIIAKSTIKENIQEYHSGDSWLSILKNLYNNKNIDYPLEQPLSLDRLSIFNESEEKLQYKVVSFFYQNISSFTIKDTLFIFGFLILNLSDKKTAFAILKKRIFK
jgi:hypothetical protein